MNRKGIIIAVQVAACCVFMAIWQIMTPGQEVEPEVVGRSLMVFGLFLCILATLFTALNRALWQNVTLFVLMWVVGSYIAVHRAGFGYSYEGDPGVYPLATSILPVGPGILYIVFVHWAAKRIGERLTTN